VLCRKHGISSATFYAWKAKFGGIDVWESKRLKALDAENAKPKRLYADAMLDNAGLKELLAKMVTTAARREAVDSVASFLGRAEWRHVHVITG